MFSSPHDLVPKWVKKDDSFFVSIKGRVPSKYGWVKNVKPYTLEDFIKKDLESLGMDYGEISDDLKIKYKIFLDSVNKYNEGTPIQTYFAEYGILEKKIVQRFTKVFFYNVEE
ncbi:hypothetical protein Desmer_2052 [Desulfosporosinus meridiei DSM 13257]|uniref:Uncharacterized protein n=1 Tax=Desulfosporosinus meridiei (strain ATCC BAA-275 / DSM 13257 / KCTC 12902 / NCIMB 13706 / S10) TaxID=768704 RepID=J7IY15_DESMD|nr:hypothetical protein Desmer_2052 [Desulfosporosinus meridiei DSM 13257]